MAQDTHGGPDSQLIYLSTPDEKLRGSRDEREVGAFTPHPISVDKSASAVGEPVGLLVERFEPFESTLLGLLRAAIERLHGLERANPKAHT